MGTASRRAVVAAAVLLAGLSGCARRTAPVSIDAPHRAYLKAAFDTADAEVVIAGGEAAAGRPITADDPLRVASVSKLLVALVVLRLVEAGTLDLDRDVSDYLGWDLRNPAQPQGRITLRMLLSHTSSLTDARDYIVPLGVSMQEFIQPESWDAAHAPGSYFRYCNLNYGVIATIIERTTGDRFDRVMSRELFVPLGIDGGLNWSGASSAATAAAVVLRAPDGRLRLDDLQGKSPECPVVRSADGGCDLGSYVIGTNGALFSPQGGARISVQGLARIGQLLLGDGAIGGNRYLSAASMQLLRTPVWRFDGSNGDTEGGFYCAFGLGAMLIGMPGCKDSPYDDGRQRWGHAGSAYNLRSALWIDPARGVGESWAVTAVADDAPRGRSAYTREEEFMAAAKVRPAGD